VGFITTIALVSAFGLVALRPPMPRHSTPWNLQFGLGYLINEQPFLGSYWLAAGTVATLVGGGVGTPRWWVSVGAVAVPVAVLTALAVRTRTARPVLMAALGEVLGDRSSQDARPRRSRIPLVRVLLVPFISYRPDVRRFGNIRYGDAGRGQLLDVYAGRRPPASAPVLIYLHSGGFRTGSKMLGARPLLYRLASHGWVCVSANYRLGRRASYRGRVTDVKRVIAWVRDHGAAYGADPSTIVVAGGSAGAHLAATAALTVGDARFQPGFEEADTSISAVVAMYGYYGPADDGDDAPSSPLAYLHAGAPPFLIIHGTLDTLVLVEDARYFARELATASDQPVVYAELPGTQHNFDLFHSLRFHAVTDAVESFVSCVHART
jgi:acetyl esterase/lipase